MRRSICLWSIVLLVLVLPATVSAHAQLVQSNPASNAVLRRAPATARLRFSEPLETSYSRVLLASFDRGPISTPASHVAPDDPQVLLLDLPALAPGRYVLQWRSLSAADGHTAEGVVPFAIGDPAAAQASLVLPPPATTSLERPPVLDAVLRWLSFLAFSLVVGSLSFGSYCWRAAVQEGSDVDLGFQSVVRWLERGAAALAALAVVGMLIAAGTATGSGLLAFIGSSRVGFLLALRCALALLLLGVLWLKPRRVRHLLAGIAGGSALLSISLLSHSAVVAGSGARALLVAGLAIAFDWLHLLATAAWIGGLPPLLLALWSVRSSMPVARAQVGTVVVARFTALATASVITLATTGTYTAFGRVDNLRELWTTTYGWALTVKLVLFGALLLLGAFNRWRLHPQLAQITDHLTRVPDPAHRQGGQKRKPPARKEEQAAAFARDESRIAELLQHLKRSIGFEIAASVLLLLAVGVLTSVAPARDAAPSTNGVQSAREGRVGLTLQVVRGDIAGDVYALDVAGVSPNIKREVLLRASMPAHAAGSQGHPGEQELKLREVEPGRWGARGSLLTMPGTWNVEAIIRGVGLPDVRHTFTVDTAAADAAAGTSTRATGDPAPSLWALLLVAALLAAALSQLPAHPTWRGALQSISMVLVAAMIAVMGVSAVEGTPSAAAPPSAAATATPPGQPPADGRKTEHTIAIQYAPERNRGGGYIFAPETLRIRVGDTVTWTNPTYGVDHTITSQDGGWDTAVLHPGGQFSATFQQAGTFTYECSLHPYQAGTVIVEQAPPAR